MTFRIFRLCLAVGLVAGLPTLLSAQVDSARQRAALLKRQQQQALQQQQQQGTTPPQGMQQSEILGTIQGVAKGGIVVVDSNKQTWHVAMMPVTKVHVTGKTTAAALRSGLLVEFTAEIDGQGVVQKKIESLTVASLTKDKPMGFFPSGDAAGFGANADDEAAGKIAKAAKHSGRTTGKSVAKTQPAGTYRIVGKLIVGRGGALSVQAGRGMLAFQLDDASTIEVNLSDLSLARPGYEVTVKAATSPVRPGMAQAYEVQIKLPEPQAAPKTEPTDKPEKKKAAKRHKKGDDEDSSEAEADKL